MQPRTTWSAGLAGTLVGTILASYAPPAGGIALGGIVTVLILWREKGYKRYALAGTVYALTFAAVIFTYGGVPIKYSHTPGVALAGFGLISAGIIILRSLFTKGVKKAGAVTTDEEKAEEIARAASAASGTVSVAWVVITAKKKAAQTTGVAGVGTVTFVLNMLGVQVQIPFQWFFENGLDANMVLFVGSVMLGFHTLETLHSTWRVSKKTATASRKGVSKAASKASTAAGAATDQASQVKGSARDATKEVGQTTRERASDITTTTAETTSHTKEKAKNAVDKATDSLADRTPGVTDHVQTTKEKSTSILARIKQRTPLANDGTESKTSTSSE